MGAQLREALSYRNTWLVLVIPGAYSCTVMTFAGLWGVPFLVSQHGFTTRGAAAVCSAMLLAWALSSMAFGPLSQRLGQRKPVFVAGLVAMLGLWSVVVFAPVRSQALIVALLLAVATAAGTFILVFAFARESVPTPLGGTASGISNMGVMLGGMVMQPVVGLMLDRHWDGAMAGGARVYSLAAYQWGFALMLGWGAVALALLAFSRETRCRPFEATRSAAA
jgi:MFS family permease